MRETSLSVDDLVYPLFVVEGEGVRNPVASMPGVFQLSVDLLAEEVLEVQALGIPAVLLFGVPDDKDKDAEGRAGYDSDGIVPRAIRSIKEATPDLLVWATCACASTRTTGIAVWSRKLGRWTETPRFRCWPAQPSCTPRPAPTRWRRAT